ncbi:class I SAM-dependent RNA methyltransferase [Pelagimonas varians]|uniref:23S rRNA (Uracil(1939)-C(5))-methyltransferase RlmD n=1 Tax=Pelagimonas varians TaxID=696760 RepID=A0A238L4W8_9RHOB|nr:class I SAM-dependent RNA methyltransferase [Pelagimonas varians]PYG26580.1 23S rRNA m(5)U-1939 methyltransferase [Pelagimonas varians]SMX49442.1 23S rRNA (uracil(1939)-C(5))-methyltransferase RlmD [Pelagimonas varians]
MQRLIIERLGHKGDGIAASPDPANGPIFVPGVLPGEEVEGVVENGIMAAPKIVTPSDQRVKGPCRHSKSCGGCQLQHASDSFASAWKTEVIRRALDAQGLETELRSCITSAPQTRRRASFSARRTKKGALAGFHKKGSDVVVAVPDCQLVSPEIAASLPLVEDLAVLGASRKGELSALVTQSKSGLDVSVTGGKPVDTPLREALGALGRKYHLARVTWDDEALTRHPPVQRFGVADVTPPPGAFLQATPDGEAALLASVREALGPVKYVADLFAGCGTFALPLAQDARVHAVEGDKAMIAALDHGWRNAQGLKHVTHAARDLFRNPLLPDELEKFDGVVIDPPRAGAEAQVEQLARARVRKIAFVSCNPVTFARDAAHLTANGYALNWVQVVDQFRWSTHVELAAEFEYKG